ncbi:hypothetical protein SDC9_208128 [bioreactor metagenome]|uniref:Uncharacterized protein n=1 Tax=bioreactor metagenome TaxID=1076179 RepID=A0A645JBE3_9ZZZZ
MEVCPLHTGGSGRLTALQSLRDSVAREIPDDDSQRAALRR